MESLYKLLHRTSKSDVYVMSHRWLCDVLPSQIHLIIVVDEPEQTRRSKIGYVPMPLYPTNAPDDETTGCIGGQRMLPAEALAERSRE